LKNIEMSESFWKNRFTSWGDAIKKQLQERESQEAILSKGLKTRLANKKKFIRKNIGA